MNKLVTFTFEAGRKIFNRKYTFETVFDCKNSYEKTLDWAETTDDIVLFKQKMDDKYGYCQVEYNPYNEFYGLCSDQTDYQNYISMVEDWKNFFTQHRIRCGNIIELIEDRSL